MFATNALPFLFLPPFILWKSIHLLLCQSTCLSASTRLSVSSESLWQAFPSSAACAVGQLQLIQHRGQLHRPNLPWQSAATARPSKMRSFCGQDNVDLTMSSV